MLFNTVYLFLKCGVQNDALGANNQFMEVLTMITFDLHTGANVLRNEVIIKYDNIRESVLPRTILKNESLATISSNDYMRRMLSA